MKNCKTCKHWQLKENRYNNIVFPYDPASHLRLTDEETVIRFGYRVRYCTHPKVLFYERPDIDGAAVCDGSEYVNYRRLKDDGLSLKTNRRLRA